MFILVVDARDIGRGRLLVVDPDVLDLALAEPVAILKDDASACDSVRQRSGLRPITITRSTNTLREEACREF